MHQHHLLQSASDTTDLTLAPASTYPAAALLNLPLPPYVGLREIPRKGYYRERAGHSASSRRLHQAQACDGRVRRNGSRRGYARPVDMACDGVAVQAAQVAPPTEMPVIQAQQVLLRQCGPGAVRAERLYEPARRFGRLNFTCLMCGCVALIREGS